MRTVSIYLIVAAAALRGLVDLEGHRVEGWIVSLLAPYVALLAAERWLTPRLRPEQVLRPGSARSRRIGVRPGWSWYPLAYLLVQVGLVTGLLLVPPYQDNFLVLFIPLGLQAVQFFGLRVGLVWIALFPLATIPFFVEEPELGNFLMLITVEGLCLVVGSYAHLIQKEEDASRENQRMARELQVTHHQLQEYASQAQELAAERERVHLARELHDSVTQTVFSMNLTAQAARVLEQRDPGRVAAQLDRLQDLTISAMSQIRRLVTQLGAVPAVEGDLMAALTRLIDERLRRDGLEVHLEAGGELELTEPVIVGLCGIVQEALTNVIKHAGTRQAAVRVSLEREPAWVEIEDQGVGFETQAALHRPGHMGLSAMAERADEIGWRLSVESQPGAGTRIRVQDAGGES